MATHRYWRIYNYYASTVQDGTTSFAEIEFRSSIGGSTLFGSGTATASSQLNGTFTPPKAVDGNASTFWISASGGGDSWWEYDFGVGNAFDVLEVKITSRNDGFFGETPTHFDIQYSDDNSTWTTAWSINFQGWIVWTSGTSKTFNQTTTLNLRRLLCYYASATANDGVLSFAEVEFHATVGGSNIITGGLANASSSLNSSFLPAKAIDGNASTFWITASNSSDGWWAYSFPAGAAGTIVEIKITPRNDSFFTETPKHFALQSSTDGVTWTNIFDVFSNAWSSGVAQTLSPVGALPWPPRQLPRVLFEDDNVSPVHPTRRAMMLWDTRITPPPPPVPVLPRDMRLRMLDDSHVREIDIDLNRVMRRVTSPIAYAVDQLPRQADDPYRRVLDDGHIREIDLDLNRVMRRFTSPEAYQYVQQPFGDIGIIIQRNLSIYQEEEDVAMYQRLLTRQAAAQSGTPPIIQPFFSNIQELARRNGFIVQDENDAAEYYVKLRDRVRAAMASGVPVPSSLSFFPFAWFA